jgi:hypothetical protein
VMEASIRGEARVLAYAKQHIVLRTADDLRDVLDMALEPEIGKRRCASRLSCVANGYFPDQRRVDGEKCRVWVRQKPTGGLGSHRKMRNCWCPAHSEDGTLSWDRSGHQGTSPDGVPFSQAGPRPANQSNNE